MKTVHEIFPLELLPSIARLSSPAPGAISISLVAIGLVFAALVINTAYQWIIYRNSDASSDRTAKTDVHEV